MANTVTDFSSFVTKVPSDADIVFFPTQKPEDAQNFAQQLLEQGKKAKVFGGDGANDPGEVQGAGHYVSNFAAPISLFAYNKSIDRRVAEGQPQVRAGLVRPTDLPRSPGRAQRDQEACDAGKGQIKDRRDVVRNVKKVVIKNSILGGDFRFSTKSNDPLNGKFYIFQIQSDGSYKLVD